MRICRNDQDVEEGFSMAKSEAKNFFSDDRLLIEKYIENPVRGSQEELACPLFLSTRLVRRHSHTCTLRFLSFSRLLYILASH